MDHEITIESLTEQIGEHPADITLYIERGKRFYSANEFGKAINDFQKVKELDPSSVEADQYLKMIYEILEFRYKDIYNP